MRENDCLMSRKPVKKIVRHAPKCNKKPPVKREGFVETCVPGLLEIDNESNLWFDSLL